MKVHRRLGKVWDQCTDAERDRGRHWYQAARDILQVYADDSGYTLEQAAAVLSITSPNAQLRTNLSWTERALQGDTHVGRYPNVMAVKIQNALDDPELARDYVTGPKVSAFLRAILGDTDAVVLDRWALRAAGYPERVNKTEREKIANGYRLAAELVGETPRDFQAIVWIHIRESTPVTRKGRTIVPRLACVTL
jgi:hypothetical protein